MLDMIFTQRTFALLFLGQLRCHVCVCSYFQASFLCMRDFFVFKKCAGCCLRSLSWFSRRLDSCEFVGGGDEQIRRGVLILWVATACTM